MQSTVDRSGRIVIPKAIRSAAKLSPGTPVQFRVTTSGTIEIEAKPQPVALERRGRFTVAVSRADQQVLEQTEVDRTIAEVRADRSSGR